jgi:hypothetical protein
VIRYLLGGLLAFGALNAGAGGFYGLSGAEGVPVEWLEGSPFSSYFIPSLVLLVFIGGSFLFAAVAVLTGSRIARGSGLCAGAVVLVWIAVQVGIIGYVSWMQPVTAVGGVVVLLLSWLLPAHRRSNDQTGHGHSEQKDSDEGPGPSCWKEGIGSEMPSNQSLYRTPPSGPRR